MLQQQPDEVQHDVLVVARLGHARRGGDRRPQHRDAQEVVLGDRPRVGTGVEQHLGDAGPSPVRRAMQRRRAALVRPPRRVVIGGDRPSYGVEVAELRRQPERERAVGAQP
jgi:hypothetical protein